MTQKQKRFCQEYPKDCNAAAAARRAGYSTRTSKQMGYENLTKVDISEVINIKLRGLSDKAEVDAVWVRKKLKENTVRAMQAIPMADKYGAPTGKYRYKGTVANKSLELLGKDLGMFVDRKDKKSRKEVISFVEID